jgi:hypothetical protein
VAIVLARENVEAHSHAPQMKIEHFWLCVSVILKNCIIVRKHQNHKVHLVTDNVQIVTGS